MLYSYHNLFRFNENENNILSEFAECYSQIYRKAHATINKQNHHLFQLNLKALTLDKLTNQELVKLYKISPFDLPTIQLSLSNHNKNHLAKKEGLTGRQMNSINKMLSGNLKSLHTLSINNLEQKQNKLTKLNELLTKEKEKLDNLLISTQYKNNPTKLKR